MFARVSTYYAADAGRLLEAFRSVADALEEIEGFSHAYFLVNRDGGTALSLTLWQSEDAMLASAARADELRRTSADLGGGSVDSVEHYEVGFTVGAHLPSR